MGADTHGLLLVGQTHQPDGQKGFCRLPSTDQGAGLSCQCHDFGDQKWQETLRARQRTVDPGSGEACGYPEEILQETKLQG